MKNIILLMFIGALSIFSIVQASNIDKENMTSLQNGTTESVEDSGLTWGLHESLKDCVSCHNDKEEQFNSENNKLIKPLPELCISCHKDITIDGQRGHGPVVNGECLLCHEPHKTDNKSLLKNPIPQLCYQCHEIDTLKLIKNHTDTSYAHCIDCHEHHSGPDKKLLKENFYKSGTGLSSISTNPSVLPKSLLLTQLESLAGLQSIKIELDVDDPELLKHYGVTEDLAMIKIKELLQNSGIKIILNDNLEDSKSSFHIQLRLIQIPSQQNKGEIAALSGSFNVSLIQLVQLLGNSQKNKTNYCKATTWSTDAVFLWGTTQVEEGLSKALEVLVGQFSKDYILANQSDSNKENNKTLAQILNNE